MLTYGYVIVFFWKGYGYVIGYGYDMRLVWLVFSYENVLLKHKIRYIITLHLK